MAQEIRLKRSSIPGKVPTIGQLGLGELANNVIDGKIYFKKTGSAETIETVFTTNALITGSLKMSGSIHTTGSVHITDNAHASFYYGDGRYLTNITASNITSLGAIDHIDFNQLASPTFLTGRVHWYDDTKTLQIDTDVDGFSIEVGHQEVVRVRNTTGTDLAIGTAVFINGQSGQRPTVATASYETDAASAFTIGVVAQTINDTKTGYVVTSGILRGVETLAYAPGTQLYLGAGGTITATYPAPPLHSVRVGKVITQAAAGVIHVGIDNTAKFGELHDVIDNTTNTTYGNIVVKNGSVWTTTKQLTGSFAIGSVQANLITGSFEGDGSNIKNVMGHNVRMMTIGNVTWSLDDMMDEVHSAGLILGGEMSASGSYILINSGSCVIRNANLKDAPTYKTLFDATSSLLTTNTTKYFGISYNNGAPKVISKNIDYWNNNTEFPIGVAICEDDNDIHYLFNPVNVGDHIVQMNARFYATRPFERDARADGLRLASANRSFSVTAGAFWDRSIRYETTAKDTSNGLDTFNIYCRSGSSFSASYNNTVYDNTRYDHLGNGTLTPLSQSYYTNLWVFIQGTGNNLLAVYGRNQYASASQAIAENLPRRETLPRRIQETCYYIGQIVFQSGSTNAEVVYNSFDSKIQGSVVGGGGGGGGITIHNDLTGLQGGTTNQYYHLTAAEYGSLVYQSDLSSVSASLAQKTVSSSFASSGTGTFHGTFIGTLTGTGSWAQKAISSSFANNALTASFVTTLNQNVTITRNTVFGNALTRKHELTGSFNITGSSAFNGPITTLPTFKSGFVSGSSFTGNPKKYTVTFNKPFANNNYVVLITGEASRTYTVEVKSKNGFTINANANAGFTVPVYWQATTTGEFN